MKVLNRLGSFVNKNRAVILTGFGLTNCVASTGLAVVGTVKAQKAIEEFKKKNNVDKLSKKDIFKVTYKYYIPTVVTLSSGVTLTCLGQATSNKLLKAATAAYIGAASELASIEKKAPELIGEKAATKLKEAVVQEKIDKNYDPEKVEVTKDGDVLFMEPCTGRVFKSSWDKIYQAIAYANMKGTTGICDFISMYDFFQELGLDSSDWLMKFGWQVSRGHLIDISSKSAGLTSDNQPCCTWEYVHQPIDEF